LLMTGVPRLMLLPSRRSHPETTKTVGRVVAAPHLAHRVPAEVGLTTADFDMLSAFARNL
jgi:hypothetical protein